MTYDSLNDPKGPAMKLTEATPAQRHAIQAAAAITDAELDEAVVFDGDEMKAEIADEGWEDAEDATCAVEVDYGYKCLHFFFKGDRIIFVASV